MKLYKDDRTLKKEIRRLIHSVNGNTEEQAHAKIPRNCMMRLKNKLMLNMIDTRCRIVYRLIGLAVQLILDANNLWEKLASLLKS